MTHGYNNKFGEERFNTTILYETENATLNRVVKDWFFGTPGGVVNVTQAGDTLTAAGTLSIKAIVLLTQAGDTLAGTGALKIQGILSVAQTGDSLTAAGESLSGINGLLSAAQQDDSLYSYSDLFITGALNVTQDFNTLSATNVQPVVVLGDALADHTAYKNTRKAERVDLEFFINKRNHYG